MSATVDISETNGTFAASVETVDISNLNFGSDDSAELTPATYPITAQADGHAFEKWIRYRVSALGGSSQIDNLKIWKSSGVYKTEEGVSTNARLSGYSAATYPNPGPPVETDSGIATQVMPVAEPAGPNIGIGGSLSGIITTVTNYSDWLVLQLDVTENTPAGALNTKVFTFQYDEQ